jgi:hypothetical protein
MNFYISALLSATILIAGIIGIIRFNRIHNIYYPLLYFFWLAGFNELLSTTLAIKGVNTIVNGNIYVLLESFLITWYFKRIGVFNRKPVIFYCILTALTVLWILENFIFSTILRMSIYYRIFYSFAIVLMSIHAINTFITNSRGTLFKNSSFLVCTGFIAFYTYKVIIEAFFLYGLSSIRFQIVVFDILVYINVVVNFIYALAVLWMPKRQAFTLPS